MKRFLTVGFGLVAYGVFLATFLYAIGFTSGAVVPKAIDDGEAGGLAGAVAVDLALLTLFAVQHSAMARPAFKRRWTRVVPEPVERSAFVLLASLALALLFWQWRPIPAPVWDVGGGAGTALRVVSWAGWGLVLVSTFLISHLELFGVRQVLAHGTGDAPPEPTFRTPSLYRHVRHPIYLGFLLAFWATPSMTAGHLLFAATTAAYILVGIRLEERDLVRLFGDRYLAYRERVGMLLPVVGGRRRPASGVAGHAADAGG